MAEFLLSLCAAATLLQFQGMGENQVQKLQELCLRMPQASGHLADQGGSVFIYPLCLNLTIARVVIEPLKPENLAWMAVEGACWHGNGGLMSSVSTISA